MDSLLLKSFLPEIFLFTAILFQLICNSRLVNSYNYNFPLINVEVLWQGLFVLFCLFLLSCNQQLELQNLDILFILNSSTKTLKILISFFSLIAFIIIWRSFNLQKLNFFEFFSLFFISVLSALLLINCNDLLSVYLILEMQALTFYILASFKRNSSFSAEAGIKYFILGAFVSSLFLMGSFLIYACLGTTNFNSLQILMSFEINSITSLYWFLTTGILLLTVSLLFKTVIAPFHFWAPDIYEGAPLSSTIIFSIIPKLSIFTLFIRFTSIFLPSFLILKIFLISIGLFSVFWGAYLSLTQKRLKRLYIYSSISQMGFLIIALSFQGISAYSSVYVFLLIYLLSSVILWGSLLNLSHNSKIALSLNTFNNLRSIFLSDLASLFKHNYSLALMFLLVFFSFSGIPPLSGFLTKLMVIFSIIADNYLYTAALLALISATSSYYYLRVVKTSFFDKSLICNFSTFLITVPFYFTNIEYLIYSSCFVFINLIFFYPNIILILSSNIILNFL